MEVSMSRTSRAALCAVSLVGLVTLSACASEVPDEESASLSSSLGSLSGRVSGTGADGLRVRSTASRSGQTRASLFDGQVIAIACQVKGESILGNDVWDYVSELGGYVADAYVVTGYDGFVPGSARCGVSLGNGSNGSEGGSTSSMAQTAISLARKESGYVERAGKCNKFSEMMGRGCEEWCADFVGYVWKQSGFAVDGMTAYSGTIYDYGLKRGTTKPKYSTAVKPGDAVLWGTIGGFSAHVGMVTEVRSDGAIKVIHGNYGVGPGGAGMVYETGFISRENDAGTGVPIYAFVSPAR
jgi:hypothetical protein